MIFNFRDRRERNLHDLAIGDLNLDAGRGEGLGSLHAANCATHAPAVRCDDLYVILAVEWLQSRERLCYFHYLLLPVLYLAFYQPGSLPAFTDATVKWYLAYRNLSVYSSNNDENR